MIEAESLEAADRVVRQWFPFRKTVAAPRARVLCFAYAGGSSSLYRPWGALLPADVELLSAEYPGRWGRVREKPFESLDALVNSLASAVHSLLDRPLVLVGYSFGAMVAYELARSLRGSGFEPAHLFVAAHRAPHLPARHQIAHLDDESLLRRLSDLYGPIPNVLLRDPELRALVLRITRSDLRCLDGYQHVADLPFSCPITAWAGEQDASTTPGEVEAWRVHTNGPFETKTFPGEHFFINDHSPAMARAVAAVLGSE